MSQTFTILLVFGLAVVLRGLYAVVSMDVTDTDAPGDGHIVGEHAVRYGVTLIVIGAAISLYGVFQWPWVTAVVLWLHAHA